MLFLMLGTFWFWIFVAVVLFAVAWAAIDERLYTATGLLVVSLVVLQFFSNVAPFTWIFHNPVTAVGGAIAYLVIGAIWIYPKWFSFIGHVHEVALDAKTEAAARYTVEAIVAEKRRYGVNHSATIEGMQAEAAKVAPGEIKRAVSRAVVKQFGCVNGDMDESVTPSVRYNKARVISWATYWPASMLWTLINDPVHRFYEWMYRTLAGSLQRMADKKFAEM